MSVPMNIAEGKGRYSKKEFLQFLHTARGSLYETITGLHLALRLSYLTDQHLQVLTAQSQDVLSKLSGLINYLRGSNPSLPSNFEPRTSNP